MYDFDRLSGLLKAASPQLNSLAGNFGEEQRDVVDSDVKSEAHKHTPNINKKSKEPEDQLFQNLMPELARANNNDTSPFGSGPSERSRQSCWDRLTKRSSAYINDLCFEDLTKEVQEDIKKFITPKAKSQIVQYGMVVKELLPKVDKQNFEQALTHVIKDYLGKSKQKSKDDFMKRADTKYILILNDRIIDGHHFLARAKVLDITSSLKVIDLTPVRFQEKSASVFDRLKEKYGQSNHGRKNPSKAACSGALA